MATVMLLGACTAGAVVFYAGLLRPAIVRAAEAGSHLAQWIIGY